MTAEDRTGAGGSRFQATRFAAVRGKRLLDQEVEPGLEQRQGERCVQRRRDEEMSGLASACRQELGG